MKKIVLLITILFVSVISTACINNLAVQELNNKAKEYMANGEIEMAICRLRSSIDLDDSIFETHYNLGVALISGKEYKEAQKSLENAINLKPDFADAYYSLAMAFEYQADEIINGQRGDNDDEKTAKAELTDEQNVQVVDLYNSAVDNYNKYISKAPESNDKEKVAEQVEYLNKEINKYNSLRSTELSDVNVSNSNAGNDD